MVSERLNMTLFKYKIKQYLGMKYRISKRYLFYKFICLCMNGEQLFFMPNKKKMVEFFQTQTLVNWNIVLLLPIVLII